MSYQTLFWISIAFHLFRTRIYIGTEEDKYRAATMGILLKKRPLMASGEKVSKGE